MARGDIVAATFIFNKDPPEVIRQCFIWGEDMYYFSEGDIL